MGGCAGIFLRRMAVLTWGMLSGEQEGAPGAYRPEFRGGRGFDRSSAPPA